MRERERERERERGRERGKERETGRDDLFQFEPILGSDLEAQTHL